MAQRKPTDDVQLKVRMREDLRRRLEREAKRNNISLNAEVVSRLARSFDASDRLDDLFGGGHNTALFLRLLSDIREVEARHSSRWVDDPETKVEVQFALNRWSEIFAAASGKQSLTSVERQLPENPAETRPKTGGTSRKER